MRFLPTLIIASYVLVGCGQTYTTTKKATENQQLENDSVFIISSDSNASIEYIEAGDGSVIIICGDGDNYVCDIDVYIAEPVIPQ